MENKIEKGTGYLKFGVFDISLGSPAENAKVVVSKKDGDKTTIVATVYTNSSGQTVSIELETPSITYTLEPSDIKPYATYDALITLEGFEDFEVFGIQVYADTTAIQNVNLTPLKMVDNNEKIEKIEIPPPTIVGNYPKKEPENEEKQITNETGFVVLDKVVIPEFIVVHTGEPNDSTAKNFWVPYKDYIKNVASSEIFSTWPEAAIRANILVINSFTLNRVYTEWYRSRGKNFTITNSTKYDQFFVAGRNIFESINLIVDEMFTTYIKRPNQRQPLLTQYCDGRKVSCPNWLSQWGSATLAEQGYSAIQILRYYYGNDIYLENAEKVNGAPSSYPDYILDIGASGEPVKTIQNQLNTISKNYPVISKMKVDGIYGKNTKENVEKFQQIFNLPKTGAVDFATWYEISKVYVAVERLA